MNQTTQIEAQQTKTDVPTTPEITGETPEAHYPGSSYSMPSDTTTPQQPTVSSQETPTPTLEPSTNINLPNPDQSSIKVARTTKGYTWEVKIYFNQNVKGRAIDVTNELQVIDTKLKNKFGGD